MTRILVATVVVICMTWLRPSVAQVMSADIHVEIVTSAIDGIFPHSWLSADICAEAEMLSVREVERSQRILNVALKKYPTPVLAGNLAKIYVVGGLRFSGIIAGGTNSNKNVYIANRGGTRGVSDQWIEKTFHSEFSSILLRNFPLYFDRDAWKAANVDTFEYGGSGVSAIAENKAGTKFDESLHAAGFMYEYSKSTLENDFNSIARELFHGDSHFWLLATKQRRIGEKIDLAIDFYRNVDPKFTREYFQGLVDQSGAKHGSPGEMDMPSG